MTIENMTDDKTPNAVRALNVFDSSQLVGTIFDTDPIGFEYANTWLESNDRYAIASIALVSGRNSSKSVNAFFENLLPEGVLRDALSLQHKTSSVFSLLKEVAGDSVGLLTILPAGETPQIARYENTSWSDIAATFAGKPSDIDNLLNENRVSVSGAQRKLSINLAKDGVPSIPVGTSPSLYIVKPDILAIPNVLASAVNEAFTMRIAKHCGLDVAEVFYEPISKSCVVKRFDRVESADGSITRLIQYDFCQLLGQSSDKKYESEGGPGIVKCAEIIKSGSARPAADLLRFYEWILFNLMTGNNDSHAKNLSLYRKPDKTMRLTPFYDLMCTRLYPGLSQNFSFKIGGESIPSNIGLPQLNQLAADLNVKSSYLESIIKSLVAKLPNAIDRATEEIIPTLGYSERILAERISHKIRKISRSFVNRLRDEDQDQSGEDQIPRHRG